MNNFKIGDLLVGTKINPYGITNKWAIVKVLRADDEGMLYVKVVKLRSSAPEDVKREFDLNHFVGFEDFVRSEYFELYNDRYYYDPEINKFGYFEDTENLIYV